MLKMSLAQQLQLHAGTACYFCGCSETSNCAIVLFYFQYVNVQHPFVTVGVLCVTLSSALSTLIGRYCSKNCILFC